MAGSKQNPGAKVQTKKAPAEPKKPVYNSLMNSDDSLINMENFETLPDNEREKKSEMIKKRMLAGVARPEESDKLNPSNPLNFSKKVYLKPKAEPTHLPDFTGEIPTEAGGDNQDNFNPIEFSKRV